MRNLFLFSLILFSTNVIATNSEVSKILIQVFHDSTIDGYLSKYGGADSLGYAIVENHGDYYIYKGDIKNKQSAMKQPYIGVIKKMKISSNSAVVKLYIKNNHLNIKAKLSRTDSHQPWLLNSRRISNLYPIRNNQKWFIHYSSN